MYEGVPITDNWVPEGYCGKMGERKISNCIEKILAPKLVATTKSFSNVRCLAQPMTAMRSSSSPETVASEEVIVDSPMKMEVKADAIKIWRQKLFREPRVGAVFVLVGCNAMNEHYKSRSSCVAHKTRRV